MDQPPQGAAEGWRRVLHTLVMLASMATVHAAQRGSPILHRKIPIPAALLASATHEGQTLRYGGDVRLGDLTGDGQADLLVFRSTHGGMKPCFLGAFTMDGQVLWTAGTRGGQPARPGPVAIHDIDGDGKAEVVCFFIDRARKARPESMANVVIQIRDGATGEVKKQAAPDAFTKCRGKGANWCHHRILIANFRGTPAPRDFVVKLGEMVLAFDQHLRLLWSYRIPWNDYSRCSAYIPSVGDIDGDGRDEVNGGYFVLDHDGTPRWEKQLGRHMDSVAITEWDNGKMRAICSGFGHVMDADGNVVLKLGEEAVPHGQEVRVADFVPDLPGPEMVIRYNGHSPHAMLVSNAGKIVKRFKLNPSPNETGMEAVYWHGPDQPALLHNGGMLWRGTGEPFARMPGLPPPVGPPKMGWYHCIPADLCGDAREEMLLYNPWDRFIYVYTPAPLVDGAYKGYRAGPRQYNARLMD